MDPHGTRAIRGDRTRPLIRERARFAVAAVLWVAQVALVITGRGTVPLPGISLSVAALPAILGGVLAGPLAGLVIGATYGALSFVLATTPLFQNPVIALVPRLLIGLVAAGAYTALRRMNESAALLVAGALGALTNTGLILLLAAVIPGPVGAPYVAPATAWDVARSTLPAEIVLAAIVTLVAGRIALRIRT